ncbi:sulfotransferase 1C2-like [Amphibalanus amphitrite]|uniref:sulfotransferase 1C2-like n=1 Tax=Amphibalanus amphitrite TaxID=1232801 RepID=UPI001C90F259|nr:sulfotransferase 1C2-like [Amphibalanus amphitrite]
MASPNENRPFPFKLLPPSDDVQQRVARNFVGLPNGLVSCNHWGYKSAASATDRELEELYNHPLDARDTWVVTPPKCGTNWTLEMVWLIANDLDYERAKAPLKPDRWSFIDFHLLSDKAVRAKLMPARPGGGGPSGSRPPADGVQVRPSPAFVNTHLPMSLNNPRLLDVCKVVYVARNPKDACVSFYNHCRLIKMVDFTGNLEEFMEMFMNGEVIATPIVDHIIEAWNLRHHPNMCFLFYEDMKKDLRAQIRKVATFLGKTFTDDQVDKLAEHLHIDNFKKNPYVNMEGGKMAGFMYQDRGNFIRKGKTGDWKNHFSPEMTARFDAWLEHKLRGTDLTFVQELEHQD